MKFILSPSSGYSDSYFDVKFKIDFNLCDEAIITLINETEQKELIILSVSNGYILDENKIVVNKVSSVSGFINIFNDDKMNKKLAHHSKINIKCKAKIITEDKVKEESETFTFYNESMSLDAGIIPFDLVVENADLNISDHKPLIMHCLSSGDHYYELCVQSQDRKQQCYFYIRTHAGKNRVEIPSEVLFYDLQLDSNAYKKFNIHWVRLEGINYHQLRNRKYILIPDTELNFSSAPKFLLPEKQERTGPTNSELPIDFVLSNRYLVPTSKKFSGLTRYVNDSISNLPKLLHESYDLEIKKKFVVETFSSEKPGHKHTERLKTKDFINKNHKSISTNINESQKELMHSMISVYQSKISENDTIKNKNIKAPVTGKTSSKGCGCSKNKK